jgi:hypothetical protein
MYINNAPARKTSNYVEVPSYVAIEMHAHSVRFYLYEVQQMVMRRETMFDVPVFPENGREESVRQDRCKVSHSGGSDDRPSN